MNVRLAKAEAVQPLHETCVLKAAAPTLIRDFFRHYSHDNACMLLPERSPRRSHIAALRSFQSFTCREDCPMEAMLLGGMQASDIKAFGLLIDTYERWFFQYWMNGMTVAVARAVEKIDEQRGSSRSSFRRLRVDVGRAARVGKELNALLATTQARVHEYPRSARLHAQWMHQLNRGSGLLHDWSNVFTSYVLGISSLRKAGNPSVMRSVLSTLQDADFSSVRSTLNLSAKINNGRSRRAAVQLSVGEMPAMVLPEDRRVSFFRIMNELDTNAIKYSPKGRVRIAADVIGSLIFFHVLDNGVGIQDMDALLGNIREKNRYRERPDLAKGHGIGIFNAVRIAAEEKWGFYIASIPGVGTDAGIYMDRSQVQMEETDPETFAFKSSQLRQGASQDMPNDIFGRLFLDDQNTGSYQVSFTDPFSSILSIQGPGDISCLQAMPYCNNAAVSMLL